MDLDSQKVEWNKEKVNLYICYNGSVGKGGQFMERTGWFPERNPKQIVKDIIDAIFQLL